MVKIMAKGFDEIKKDIIAGNFAPIYLFQGEEEYFIDQLTDLVIEKAIADTDRDFNQTIFYGADSTPAAVINACRRFPMMSDRQIVVLKEAQNMKPKDLEELVYYVEKPLASTILVISHKQDKLDGRKKLSSTISKKGIVFESQKIRDYQIPAFINNYLKSKKVAIDDKATQLLAEYLGTNISKLVNEMEKLTIILPADNRRITATLIEQNIGISKDFNNFELQRALAKKDVLKANRIAQYFERNPKSNPLVVTLTTLFNFFSNLMICHYLKKNEQNINGIKSAFGFRFDMQTYDYTDGLKNYKPMKTMQIISLIRECDARSKGFGNVSLTDGMLLKELIYKIMH
jgi:DNA polymerase-3 subunit delta